MSRGRTGAFHHVDLNVRDLARSRPFYAALLTAMGYRCAVDRAEECRWDLAESAPGVGDGAALTILQARSADRDHAHRRYAPGLHHLSWRAASRAEVDRVHAAMRAAGIAVLHPPQAYPEYDGSYYAVFFEDPEGIKLEVAHTPDWI